MKTFENLYFRKNCANYFLEFVIASNIFSNTSILGKMVLFLGCVNIYNLCYQLNVITCILTKNLCI